MGFRDDFSIVVLSSTSHDLGSGALQVSAVTAEDPANPQVVGLWSFTDDWFLRRAANLQANPTFDIGEMGLPALPAGYSYYGATGGVSLLGGAMSPASRGAGVIGVRMPIEFGLGQIGSPRLTLYRASDGAELAIIGGPIAHATLKEKADNSTAVTCWTIGGGYQDMGADDAPYWRIDADSNTGAVTCSLAGDEEGKQVRASFTQLDGIPADGALMFAGVSMPLTMLGPAQLTALNIDPATLQPQPLLSVYSWAYAVSTVVAGDGDAGALRR